MKEKIFSIKTLAGILNKKNYKKLLGICTHIVIRAYLKISKTARYKNIRIYLHHYLNYHIIKFCVVLWTSLFKQTTNR